MIYEYRPYLPADVKKSERRENWVMPGELNSGGDEAHVDAPEQADKAQEDDPAVDRNEREADNGGDGPDLVSGYDDGNGFLS